MAWQRKDTWNLAADRGPGYWLGVAAAIIMAALFAYPLRKRARFMHRLGRIANWFRLHMIIGIVGPMLAVLHSNFRLGSLNSRVALFTMLTVVASGIAGRYLYALIHNGLYGQQLTLLGLLGDIEHLQQELERQLVQAGEISPSLARIIDRNGPRSVTSRTRALGISGREAGKARRAILKRLGAAQWQDPASGRLLTPRERKMQVRRVDGKLRRLCAEARKADRLAVYERLFGLWHHLHTPLFALLAITVVMHIIAVELY